MYRDWRDELVEVLATLKAEDPDGYARLTEHIVFDSLIQGVPYGNRRP